MDSVRLECVSKTFRHRPALFNRLAKETSGEVRALHNISLRVPAGSVLALLGPNGSGKTTLLKLISSMLHPDAGRVIVHGQDTQGQAHAVRRQVSFVIATERSFFPRLSARENLDFFATLDEVSRDCRAARIEMALNQVDLANQEDTLTMKFSSGMYQRLGVARALLKQASVMLLDEPTRSLDPAAVEDSWDLMRNLRDSGVTLIVATHNFEEASRLGDSLAVLRRGHLVYNGQGRPDEHRLRSLYFDLTSQAEELEMTVGGWR